MQDTSLQGSTPILSGDNLWSMKDSIARDVWSLLEDKIERKGEYITYQKLSDVKYSLRDKTNALVSLATVDKYDTILELVVSQIDFDKYLKELFN